MNENDLLYQRLCRLNIKLDALKSDGHEFVEGGLESGWLRRLASGKEKMGKAGDDFSALQTEALSCRMCGLEKTRTNVVFGVGDTNARIMFVGEAPGADEDRQGEPFVGRAGKLLTKMIEAMGIDRNDVYIANILKCRPPGNRDPLPGEVDQCEGYLIRQIEKIRPEVICALGAVAARTLLKTKTPISRLRGEFHSYHGTPLLPTFHPAYLLRNPAVKTEAWKDIQMLMEKTGLKRPSKED